MITSLKPNQIFVFGSNLAGKHIGGAALQAKEQFGAEEGVGEGLTGQAYAFPTLNEQFEQRSFGELYVSLNELYRVAKENPDKEFLLTKVGCGIAQFPEEQMKDLFSNAPANIIKPDDWND